MVSSRQFRRFLRTKQPRQLQTHRVKHSRFNATYEKQMIPSLYDVPSVPDRLFTIPAILSYWAMSTLERRSLPVEISSSGACCEEWCMQAIPIMKVPTFVRCSWRLCNFVYGTCFHGRLGGRGC